MPRANIRLAQINMSDTFVSSEGTGMGAMHFFRLATFFVLLAGSAQGADTSRILLMGDSLMAVHRLSGRAIANEVARALDEPVTDRSVSAARIIYDLPITGSMGMNIGKQFRAGDWDWIIVNGGGNDILFGCGCKACERKINRLISDGGDGGRIPKMVTDLRKSGARVIYVGYLRSPGVGSLIENCRDEGDMLEQRIAAMAILYSGVFFLSLTDLVPYGDRSFHTADMIHPSVKASTAIGNLVADIIRANE